MLKTDSPQEADADPTGSTALKSKEFASHLLAAADIKFHIHDDIVKLGAKMSLLEAAGNGDYDSMADILTCPDPAALRENVLYARASYVRKLFLKGKVPVMYATSPGDAQKEITIDFMKTFLLESNYTKKTKHEDMQRKLEQSRALSLALTKVAVFDSSELRELCESVAVILASDEDPLGQTNLDVHIGRFAQPLCPLYREAQSWPILKLNIGAKAELSIKLQNDEAFNVQHINDLADNAPVLPDLRPDVLETPAELTALADKWETMYR